MPKSEVLLPGVGEQLTVRDSTLIFKAVAATTGGAFSLHERQVPAGGRRPPAHVHPDRVEAFWVLAGEAEFELDDDFRELQQLWSGDEPPARDAELALMRRHGMQPV